jgi:hypothetical protein
MNDDTLSHRITVTVAGRYLHGKEQEQATVTIAGDGSIDHALETFRAALVAMGFSPAVAGRLALEGD